MGHSATSEPARETEVRRPSETTKIEGIDTLDTLLQVADHIALTLPLTEETQNILSPKR